MATATGSTAPSETPAPGQDPGGRGRAGASALSLIALAVALALTFQAWRSARRADEAEARTRFAALAADADGRVWQRMLAHEQVLRGAEGLFAASAGVDRSEFRAYVAALRLEEAYPGIQGVGFAALVPAARRAEHEAAVRREGFPGYAVRPEGPRDPYSSIVMLEPFEGRNLRAFGYDMFSEPVRRAAMERARDSGRAALSGRVTLVQETSTDVQPGTLLYLPIYRHGAPLDTVAARREALVGWVYSPYRMRDLMRGILGEGAAGLDVELYDGETPAPEALLFDADPAHAAAGQGADHLLEVHPLEIAGRRWTMVLGDTAPLASPLAARATLVAAAGTGASAVLALVLWILTAGRARALEAARRSGREAAARRRAAEEVEAARQFAQATLDAMPEQICVLGEDGRILSVNRAWREFGLANGGAPERRAEGTSYLEACDRAAGADPGAARLAAALRALLAGDRASVAHEYECHAPDRRRWFVARATRFADGAHARVVVAHQDVTERQEAVAALREGEARLRRALEASRSVEWDYDVPAGRGTIGEGWRALAARTDEPPRDLGAYLALVHPDDRAALAERFGACLEGRSPRVEVEYRLQAAGGRWRWLRTQGEVIARLPDGRPARAAGTVADVDEVHGLQDNLLAATRLASVGTLAAGVAHEINNPLAWIHANLGLALELLGPADGPVPAAGEEPGRELRQLLKESLEGTDRIAAIVKAMRSLGRPEQAEEARLLDVGRELGHALHLVRNQLQQRADLRLELPPGLPAVRARTSELGRVFLNLLLNAAHAVAEVPGRPHRVEVAARAAAGEVIVEVRDTGPGIPPGVRERIFDPFFTTKPVGQGTGLGLPIARSIVDAAGGRLEVESEPGRGATFRVRLPAATGPAEPPAPAPDRAAPPARRRVLVVDDEPLVTRSLERLLSPAHEVTVLRSGEEALRRLDAGERWEALLVDLMMPGLDGPAVHAALAARHPALLGRLAFITGGAFGERAAGFLASHPVQVLAKPFQRAALLELVERLAAG